MHDIARKHIKISSDGMKRFYDRNKHFTEIAVWYFYTERRHDISLKLYRNWKGPYIITKKFGDNLYQIQKNARGKPKLVHHDKLKPYLGENKPTWFVEVQSLCIQRVTYESFVCRYQLSLDSHSKSCSELNCAPIMSKQPDDC